MCLYTIALISALALISPDGPPAAGEKDHVQGVDLFIEACRWQGSNPVLIRSGRARFERTFTTTTTEEAIRREVDRAVASQRELIKNETDPETRKVLEGVLKNIPQAVRAHHSGERKSRIEILFDGNDSATGRRRFEVVNYDPVAKQWARPIIGISRNATRAGGDTLVCYDAGSLAKYTKENHGVAEIAWFGRMQGTPSMVATASFLKGRDIARFDFSPEGIAEFKAGIAQLVAAGQSIFHVTREVDYENGATAFEIESQIRHSPRDESRLMQRYWIDAARGYVCPLIQLCDGNGRLVSEWKSGEYFLDEESGVWFPAVHVRTTYAPETGAVAEREEFRFDRASVRFNQKIADEEFSIRVPQGAEVLDARSEPQRHYSAPEPVSLTFVPGGRALDEIPGLRSAEGLGVVTARRSIEGRRVALPQLGRKGILLALNVGVLALLGAAVAWRKLRRRAAAAALLIGSLAVAGCTPPPSDTGEAAVTLVVEPAALDFGRVRESDEPLKLKFAIKNRGPRPVEIADVRTGCGCTVAKPAASTVLPGEAVEVPVTVKTRGRRGPFLNSVYIQPAGSAGRTEVPIRGTIVNDIWYNGQVIRCSTAADSPTASGLFDLSTADWPLLEFDWGALDPGVSVTELSRATGSGETVMRFRFTVEVPRGARAVEKSIILRPIDPRVHPLTVPIVCYRDEPKGASVDYGPDAEGLRPARISVGAIPAGQDYRFSIFGDPALLSSLIVDGSDGLPRGVTAELSATVGDGRRRILVLRVGQWAPSGLFNGQVRFRSPRGHILSVAVLGLVRSQS